MAVRSSLSPTVKLSRQVSRSNSKYNLVNSRRPRFRSGQCSSNHPTVTVGSRNSGSSHNSNNRRLRSRQYNRNRNSRRFRSGQYNSNHPTVTVSNRNSGSSHNSNNHRFRNTQFNRSRSSNNNRVLRWTRRAGLPNNRIRP
jgi:hypothetical protein